MTYRLIATGFAFFLIASTAAAQDNASISLANGTDHVFTSVTISALDRDITLGATVTPLRPGQSVTIPLSSDQCGAVDVLAVFEGDKLITAMADACDSAIYTLTD